MDVDSGRQSWSSRFEEERRGHGRPRLALSGNAAYFTQHRIGRPSRLFCMNLKTRRITWQKQIGEVRSLLATRKGVFVRGRSVQRFACRTGNLLWSCEAEGCGPLALIGRRIYFVDTSRQGRLISLDQRTGHRIWEIPGIRSCDAFARLGQTGYIKTQDGVVRAISLKGLDL
jgi:outer membrane protein assembly factor BamB